MGKPVGGGQMSLVDNPKSLMSSCTYTVNRMPTVIVMVADYPSAAGIGDSAFWTSADALSITAVQGPRLATMAVVGGTSALHDRLHALMVKALSR